MDTSRKTTYFELLIWPGSVRIHLWQLNLRRGARPAELVGGLRAFGRALAIGYVSKQGKSPISCFPFSFPEKNEPEKGYPDRSPCTLTVLWRKRLDTISFI